MTVDMYDGKNDLKRQIADWKVRAEAAEAENTRLRAALAQSELPCVYCSLPRDKWEKCESGFPGCARADDAMGCPELGARVQLEAAEARVQELENLTNDTEAQALDLADRLAEAEARLTVTDEMVERAAKTLQQYCLLPLPPWTTVARAALTAALENKS